MNSGILGDIERCAQVEVIYVNHTKRAPLREMTLLIMILKSSSEAVGVPTSLVYQMRLPSMAICVRLGSFFCGRTLQNTEV